MTNMKQKSVEAKRARRTRHKAVAELRHKFGCTTAQLPARMSELINARGHANSRLETELQEMRAALLTAQGAYETEKANHADTHIQLIRATARIDYLEAALNEYEPGTVDSKESHED
jgi:hypothetical protein